MAAPFGLVGEEPLATLLKAYLASNPAAAAALLTQQGSAPAHAPPAIQPPVALYQSGSLTRGFRLGDGQPEGQPAKAPGPAEAPRPAEAPGPAVSANAAIAAIQPAAAPMANLRGPSTLRINEDSGGLYVKNGKPAKENRKDKRKSFGNKDTTAASTDSTAKASDKLKLIQVFLIPDWRIVENEIDLSEPKFGILLGLIEKWKCVGYPALLKSDSAKEIARKVNAELPTWKRLTSFNWAHVGLGPNKVLRDKGDSDTNTGERLSQVFFKHTQAFIYARYAEDPTFLEEFKDLVSDATGEDISVKGSDTDDDEDRDEYWGLEHKELEVAEEKAACGFCDQKVLESALEQHESICKFEMKSKAKGSQSSIQPPTTPTKTKGKGTSASPIVFPESPEVKKSPSKRKGSRAHIVADPVKYARQGARAAHTQTSRNAAASAAAAAAAESRLNAIRDKVLDQTPGESNSSLSESSSRTSLLSPPASLTSSMANSPTASITANMARTRMTTRASSRSASEQPH